MQEPKGRDCVTRKGSESRYTSTAVFWSLKEETVWPERNQDQPKLPANCKFHFDSMLRDSLCLKIAFSTDKEDLKRRSKC